MEPIQQATPAAADHLCVLVHGLWGNPGHLSYLSHALRTRYGSDLHILVAKRNSGSLTYDGIELGAQRVTVEIEETLEELERSGHAIKKISIIGYSLGGLVARYAIGLLYSKGWFDKLEPVNFTTFATPHLGVRTPLLGYHNHLWNIIAPRLLSASGRQLFTIDSFRNTGRPLLSVMADPDSIFIAALKLFKNRSLYANVVNDITATFYSCAISPVDYFVNLSAVKVNYLQGWEPTLVDAENPVSPKDEGLPAFTRRLKEKSRYYFRRTPILILLIMLLPIGAVLFIINAGVQSIRSRYRIRLHQEGKAGIDAGLYRIPLMINSVRREAEEMFEEVNSMQRPEYLPAGSEEWAAPSRSAESPQQSPTASRPASTPPKGEVKIASAKLAGGEKFPTQQPRQLKFPTLALTPRQFAMIDALDKVGWKKHLVQIHNVTHSHAAIIYRKKAKRFGEGKIVVRHWLDGFEV